MALFGKKEPVQDLLKEFDKLSDEDKKSFIDILTADDKEPNEETTEATDTTETTEAEPETEETTEETAPVEETEVDPVVEEEAQEEVDEAEKAKWDKLFEEFASYKAKVDKIYERLDEVEEPAATVGLGKQKTVEVDDDENESAYDYALKHAKY